MTVWADVPSFGSFVCFEREPVEAGPLLIEALVADLGLGRDLKMLTKRWFRGVTRKAIDAAVASRATREIESINGSIIFDSTPSLIEAWSPEFLAATTSLRRLLWPISTQHPADDPDARPKRRR
jgi:hypothetical protein